MIHMNELVGVPALGLGLLIMWAFRRYARTLSGTATSHLGAAMFWFNVLATGRSVWWDFFGGFGLGITPNWFWNTLSIFVSWHALKALHMLLPPAERSRYNLITVAFYPRRLWRWAADRDDSPQEGKR